MVILAWNHKKAVEQLKTMCKKYPVDFFLLKRALASTSAMRDVIRDLVGCKVNYTPPEIVDIDAALKSTKYGNNTGEWKEKLQEFAPDTVTDKELADWIKNRTPEGVLYDAIHDPHEDPVPGSTEQALTVLGFLLARFLEEQEGKDEASN